MSQDVSVQIYNKYRNVYEQHAKKKRCHVFALRSYESPKLQHVQLNSYEIGLNFIMNLNCTVCFHLDNQMNLIVVTVEKLPSWQ